MGSSSLSPNTGIKSIQQGFINLTGGTNTATISAVNAAKSICIHTGGYSTHTSAPAADREKLAHIYLTNSTTVSAGTNVSQSGGFIVGVRYQIVEYY